MAFPNRRNRRVNWNYVCRLCDELERLGHSVDEVPERVLRSPWPEIREYLMHNLKLQVCAWCKMPKAPEEMGNGHLCIEHEATMQEHISSRRTVSSIRNQRQRWKMNKLYGDEPEITPLAGSDLERIRKLETELSLRRPDVLGPPASSAADVLERAAKRPR